MVKIEQRVLTPCQCRNALKKALRHKAFRGQKRYICCCFSRYLRTRAAVCLRRASSAQRCEQYIRFPSVGNGLPHCLQWVVGVCVNTASNPASSGRTDLRKYLHSALLVKQIPNIGQSLVVTSFVSLVSVQARKTRSPRCSSSPQKVLWLSGDPDNAGSRTLCHNWHSGK